MGPAHGGILKRNERLVTRALAIPAGSRLIAFAHCLRRRLRFAPYAATATVAMDPVKLDESWKKSRAELMAQLNEIKSELKELREERLRSGLKELKLTDGAPNKLSELDKLRPFLEEEVKKHRAKMQEAYSNLEPLPLILRFNSQEDPCCTAASPPGVVMLPAFSEDGEGKEA